jgi:hypothetical protein
LGAGYSYSLTMDDAVVAAGQRLKVDASALDATGALTLDASAETEGYYTIVGAPAPTSSSSTRLIFPGLTSFRAVRERRSTRCGSRPLEPFPQRRSPTSAASRRCTWAMAPTP